MASPLEDLLAKQLDEAHINYEREYKAIEGRRYKHDFYITGADILVEIQGGLWMKKGGHTSGVGVSNDCEKLCLSVLAGYRPLLVTAAHVKSGQALAWIKEALK